jgi:hypothetical protein
LKSITSETSLRLYLSEKTPKSLLVAAGLFLLAYRNSIDTETSHAMAYSVLVATIVLAALYSRYLYSSIPHFTGST